MNNWRSYRLLAVGLVAILLFGAGLPAYAQDHAAPAAQDEEHAAEDDHAAQDDHAAADDHGGDAEHAEGEHHFAYPTATEYVYKWINFGLLLVVLYFLLVVPPAFVKENFEFEGLKVILAARSKAIVESRELARQQQEQAASGLAASSERMAKIETEAAALVATAREDAVRDRERMVAEATEQAQVIRASASRDMQGEISRAGRELKAHVANLAVGIATDLVKKNFSSSDQDRLVREYLDRLGESVS